MTRSARVQSPGCVLVGTLAVAVTLACGREAHHDRGEDSLDLADFVFHQKSNVSTDLISVPDAVGLDRLEYGWRLDGTSGTSASWAVVEERVGRLSVFSAEGDVEAAEFELALADDAPPRRRGVRVSLNGQEVGRFKLDPVAGWSTRSVALPPQLVREGFNLITLRPGVGPAAREGHPVSSIRLRRLRLVSRSGRPSWEGRPPHVLVHDPSPRTPGDATVDMPVASFVDAVLRVPAAGRLGGAMSLVPAPGHSPAPITVTVNLLDEELQEAMLYQETFREAVEDPQRVALDLGRWAGQLVRLRFRVAGAGNAVVRWHGVGVWGAGLITEPAPGIPITAARVAPSGRLGRPDVLFVLLDAARADAFSPFGGTHRTPATERLATDGTLFRQAVAPAPWTGQSVSAILTGLFPDTLGVGPWGSALPEVVPTLAELMAAAGYRTVLWSQHPLQQLQPSLTRGFEVSHLTATHLLSGSPDFAAVPEAEDLVSATRPTFAFVHLVPPHQPYTPPAPFRGSFTGWYDGEMDVSGRALERLAGRAAPPSAIELKYARDRYLENAAFADNLLDGLLSSLDHEGRYRDALVVLLSDHGEAFYEHGRFLHSLDVHRESLHVPLIVKWPVSVRRFAREVTGPVSLVDLVPTLVDGLSLATDAGFQGRSLLPICLDGVGEARPVYAMTRGHHASSFPPRPHLMLESGVWRVLHRLVEDETRVHLVASDPLEHQDRGEELPLRTLLLRQSVLMQSAWNHDHLGGPPARMDRLDPEELEQLEALGYLDE